MSLAPVYGLVLAGGASKRMGRDKAALEYHGRPQLDWVYELLERHCERVFVSIRRDQAADPARAARPSIVDLQEGLGPIAGIAAAQAAHPGIAWLVVACDLPYLTDRTIEHLLSRRGRHAVTAYRSRHDGLPEPLCAIYEPITRDDIVGAIARGKHCPRKFIIGTGVPLLDPLEPAALDNVNTAEEFAAAREQLQPGRGANP